LACDTEGAEIYYTLDGSVPTKNTNLYTEPINITKNQILKIRSFHQDLKPSMAISHAFEKAVFKNPVLYKILEQGLFFEYYEKFFVSTNDLDDAIPINSGLTDIFTIKNADRNNYFGYQFEGLINVPKEGIYTFYSLSNDGSRLYIDDEEIIENDGNHGSVEEQGDIALKAGYHKIKVKYIQCGGGKSLTVSWKGPEFLKHQINTSELYYDTKLLIKKPKMMGL